MKNQKRNWERNLAAIKITNYELADKLKNETTSCDWITVINSQNGDKNMLVKKGSEFLPAYDMDNPSKEAKTAVSKMELYTQNVSIIIGAGLGYLTNAILKKAEKGHRIVVTEPIIPIIKLALYNFDFSKAITRKELIIITDAEQTTFILQIIAGQFVIEGWMMTTDKYITYRPDEYSKVAQTTGETLNQILCNTGTIAGAAGGIIADNDVSCLPYVIRHRGVTELKGLFKNKPAILVSTGPSLAKNIHHIVALKDHVVIVAVGQALRVLLAYGIRPDFITSVDFGEVNIGHFKGLMDSGVPLVTINRTYAPLLQEWQGPKFIAATPVPGFEKMATGILTDKGFVEAGGSVAHMSFGLAQLLECNPIMFVGQDLSLGET
ncbi:MAG TPA: DUF115 domain-containing protein, partial [bacterium]|nr:DUF115 domain-containing protein [bacterium]